MSSGPLHALPFAPARFPISATLRAGGTSASATVDPPGGSWDHTWTTTDADKGGTVYVEENGDVVSVCDTA
ncbi:hypothetical protein [Amycolatopsis sp. CA-126428]|uniref:hypothetical protein n=1 Tax=Amycolatopsis sp. CA-126428 TaxID=2073158 RepID=UPI0011B0E1FF|nr:hypothetical protein [Amycolatopsis sp. CA-126428]